MIALLDAGLLIALFDAARVNHAAAQSWLSIMVFRFQPFLVRRRST